MQQPSSELHYAYVVSSPGNSLTSLTCTGRNLRINAMMTRKCDGVICHGTVLEQWECDGW